MVMAEVRTKPCIANHVDPKHSGVTELSPRIISSTLERVAMEKLAQIIQHANAVGDMCNINIINILRQ